MAQITDSPKNQKFYRFRSCESLLGEFEELERQEIFLSPPDKLNDPLEGYQNVFWDGDEILWENLLRHYALSLLWAHACCLLVDKEGFERDALRVDLTRADLPTDRFRQTYDAVCSEVFSSGALAILPSLLASAGRPLRRFALQYILTLVHGFVLRAIQREMASQGILNESASFPTGAPDPEDFKLAVETLTDGEIKEDRMELLLAATSGFGPGVVLRHLLAQDSPPDTLNLQKFDFLVSSFPKHYVDGICNSLVHSGWQVACFSGGYVNPSMWGSYGDEHRGVALEFSVAGHGEGSPCRLPVRGITGSSSTAHGSVPTEGDMHLTLQKVQYAQVPPETDFFRFLGTLPLPTLLDTWYSNRDGKTSPLFDEIRTDEPSWHNELWELFRRKTTTKMPAWSHEEEWRVVTSDVLTANRSGRKVRYEIRNLTAVIFGLKTPFSDKAAIARILARKCRDEGVSMVPLYQMAFDGATLRASRLLM